MGLQLLRLQEHLFEPLFRSCASDQGHVLGVIPFALPAGGYLSTVMPSILAIWVASYIQKFFTKMTPDVIKVFVVPLFTLLITVSINILGGGTSCQYFV